MWIEVLEQTQKDVQKLMANGGTFTLFEVEVDIEVVGKVNNLIRQCEEKTESRDMKGNAIAFLEWPRVTPLSLEETGQILQAVVAATKCEPLIWNWRETENSHTVHLYVMAEVS